MGRTQAELVGRHPSVLYTPDSLAEQPLRMVIVEAANRAAALTRQMLAFGRRQVLKVEPLDLNAEIGKTEQMLRRVIGEDIVIDLQLAPELPRVAADPSQVQQVLLNLAVNARDAMPHGILAADVRLLVKPYNAETLLAAVRAALDG